MKREDCWMSFSEALESYLKAREAVVHFGAGYNRECAKRGMQDAAEHMDALTAPPEREADLC